MMWVCFVAVMLVLTSYGCGQRGFENPFDAGGNASVDSDAGTDSGNNPVDGGTVSDAGQPDSGTTDAGCISSCVGRQCGLNNCGESCGACPVDKPICNSLGECVCVPECVEKNCGPDGCGSTCDADYVPEYDKANKCLSLECSQVQKLEVVKKKCVGNGAWCDPSDGTCHVPFDGGVCVQQCANAACGDPDSCGGNCDGTCPGPQEKCVNGKCECQPACTNKC